MVQGCENYLEKYQPLFVHRQITDALDNVITNVKQKWRIKKYAESKGSFLQDKILSDDGDPDLQGRVDKTKIGIKNGQPTQEDLDAQEHVRTYQHKEDKEMDGMGSDDDESPKKKKLTSRKNTTQKISMVESAATPDMGRADQS